MWDDTIAAIATPLGEGGLAIIRLSGPAALRVADQVFVPAGRRAPRPSQAASHTLHYGHVVRGTIRVDEVLCAVMRAPRMFTREDVVEITCHGGVLASKAVLETVLANGARLAHPGEFTQRAFLNGRIDLAQAEAVADLIQARTELALSAANEQLAGKLSQRIRQLRDDLMQTLAHIEAHLDFPEEDIAPHTRTQLAGRVAGAMAWVAELLRTAPEGRILRRGIRAAIIGRPNAGKSSLLNQLLGHERAIVSPVPGTTRDTIEETASVRGIPVVFIDTAGLREVRDDIEGEGVRRSREALARAELILHVLDGSEPLHSTDTQLLTEFAGKSRILVCNKCDLPAQLVLPEAIRERPAPPAATGHGLAPCVRISSKTGAGLELLKDAIEAAIWSGRVPAGMAQVTINARHQDALKRAQESLQLAREAIQAETSLEFVALDLRQGINAIGEIVGQTTTEDLLTTIFSQFCIGK